MDSNQSAQFDRLQGIIDFAINKEQEAVDFYTRLAKESKNRAIAEELRKIANMEVGHRERLKKLDVAAAASGPAASMEDLKIGDYLVAGEPSANMTWQEVLNIAMHRELAAARLYTDLARSVADPTVKGVFETLAGEEQGHKLYFEKIYDDEILKEN